MTKSHKQNKNKEMEMNGGVWGIPNFGVANFFGVKGNAEKGMEKNAEKDTEKLIMTDNEIIQVLTEGDPEKIKNLINTFGIHMSQIDTFMKCFAGVITQMKQNDNTPAAPPTEPPTEPPTAPKIDDEVSEDVEEQNKKDNEVREPENVNKNGEPLQKQESSGGGRRRKTRKNKNRAKNSKTRRNDNLFI